MAKYGDVKGGKRSTVLVKYDIGFGNMLYIRGQGAGLNWDKGQMMKNVGPDEWKWETDLPFNECEFKVVINDQMYEAGDNHHLARGAKVEYTPRFV